MKIRMLTGLSGPDFNLAPRDLHEPDDEEAARLIAAGFAEPALEDENTDRAPASEDATAAAPVERAVRKPAKTTRKKP